jgi:hypothetical protein
VPLLPFPSKNLLLLHLIAITAAGALLALLADAAATDADAGCLCLRMLMVRLGGNQPWCVNLSAAPAAPPAHLLDCSILLCVRKPCSLVLQNEGFSLACQEASSSLLPAPVAQPVPLVTAVAAAGVGGGRGDLSLLVTCSNLNNFKYHNPAGSKNILMLTIPCRESSLIFMRGVIGKVRYV